MFMCHSYRSFSVDRTLHSQLVNCQSRTSSKFISGEKVVHLAYVETCWNLPLRCHAVLHVPICSDCGISLQHWDKTEQEFIDVIIIKIQTTHHSTPTHCLQIIT